MGSMIREDEIVLSGLFEPIVRRWRTVMVVVVAALVMVWVRLMIVTPEYEARVRLGVVASNGVLPDSRRIGLYLSSPQVTRAVLSEMGLQWSTSEYRRRVRIEANYHAKTLDIVVCAGSPADAVRIVSEIAGVITRVSDEIMQEGRLVRLNHPLASERPVRPHVVLDMALAMILGLFVGAGTAFILEILGCSRGQKSKI